MSHSNQINDDLSENTLQLLLNALPSDIKRNTYINDAVRVKMKEDGYIE
jgi:hypothetical protein